MEENPPRNEDPEFVQGIYSTGTYFLQAYGWFILVGAIGLLYIWSKLQPAMQAWKIKKEDQVHKKYDASTAQQRMEAMATARAKMQLEFDAKAEKYAEEKKKKDEEKRKQKIEDWERHQEGKGYRSKYRPKEDEGHENPQQPKPKPKKPVRQSDYNPLMGNSSGFGYRPARRGNSGGG